MKQHSTQMAVFEVLANNLVRSKYAMAKALGVQPIMINNYMHKGTRMSTDTANKFTELYQIEITDIYDNRSKVNEVDSNSV